MGAGLMQLLFFGQQDIYLKSNPSITFFKKVFKTHTNFAMESIRVDFNRTDTNIYEKTILRAKIPRHADLVGQMYFVFEIPEIISDNVMRFRWTEHIGEAIIDNYYVTIGGTIVDKQYGEYLHIMGNLNFDQQKKQAYDNLTGNIIELTNPEAFGSMTTNISMPPLRYRISNIYPTANQYNGSDPSQYNVSTPSRKIYVPLSFWFNKDIGNALPLVSLQYSEVEVVIELRPWIQLYKLFYSKDGKQDFYAPNPYISAHQLRNFVSNFRNRYLVSDTILDCKCYLETNYIYLDSIERQYFAYKPLDYLIEQVIKIEKPTVQENNVIDMILQNPVKEIIWVLKRSDSNIRNDWFNFQDNYKRIMKTAKIMFNGIDRIEEKDDAYFNYLQPFQHHSGNGKNGIYVYSFSLTPQEFQPSGSVNMSRINNIQFYMTANKPVESSYKYDATFYIINYNFLRISSGLAGVVYNV